MQSLKVFSDIVVAGEQHFLCVFAVERNPATCGQLPFTTMCWAFRVFRDIACLCGFFSRMRGLQLGVISGVGAGLNDSPLMSLTFQSQACHLLLWMSSCSWEKGVIATPFYGASSHLWSFSSSVLSRLAALRPWCLLKCKLIRIKQEENLSLGAWAPFQALKVSCSQWLWPWAVWIDCLHHRESYEGQQEEKELLEEQPFLLDTVLCGRGPLWWKTFDVIHHIDELLLHPGSILIHTIIYSIREHADFSSL